MTGICRRSFIFAPTFSHRLATVTVTYAQFFHTRASLKAAAELANHYEALGLSASASQGEIKKTHHPDHNPNDPEASDRFVKISEAYAVLGSPQTRERYDREIRRSQQPPSGAGGSYSSASAPFGARTASGLSRRRTQFRGPPPSFYRSGGWGAYGERRRAQAEATGEAARAQAQAQSQSQSQATGGPTEGGMGFGQGEQNGFANDVPHFDRDSHHRTQQQQDRRRSWRRRRQAEASSVHPSQDGGGSTLYTFLLITAIVGIASSPLIVPGF